MSEALIPPFKKGQKVWQANSTHTERKVPCPDCGGKKEISYLSHDPVQEIVIDCPVCKFGWEQRGYLTYWDVEPDVREYEIIGLRYESDRDEGDQWTYQMRGYWGNGGGTIFSGSELYDSKEDAEKRARVLADERREHHEKQIIEQTHLKRKDHRRSEVDALRLAMTAQIRRYREALEFYADPESHNRRTDAVTPVAADGGHIARQVLAENMKAPVRSN